MPTNKKPAKKSAAKKAPAKKKAVAKKAPAKKAPAKKAAKSPSGKMTINATTETRVTTPETPSTAGTVVYASEIKNLSLKARVLAWFKNQ